MLTVRRAQLDAFRHASEETLRAGIVEHLRVEHSRLVSGLPESLLTEMVSHGIARARRHGLETQRALGAFVALMFVIAPNFDEHPRLRQLLSQPEVPADLRLQSLIAHGSSEDWEEASRNYRAEAWFPEDADA